MKIKAISVTLNGENSELYSSLLNNPFRTAPKEPTHCVIIDVMHTDLSAKRLYVYFNPLDTWTSNDIKKELEKPQAVGQFIGRHLGFLGQESKTAVYSFGIIDMKTRETLYTSNLHSFLDYE
jgi:hypothetical protein